jgi:hypothetical protein
MVYTPYVVHECVDAYEPASALGLWKVEGECQTANIAEYLNNEGNTPKHNKAARTCSLSTAAPHRERRIAQLESTRETRTPFLTSEAAADAVDADLSPAWVRFTDDWEALSGNSQWDWHIQKNDTLLLSILSPVLSAQEGRTGFLRRPSFSTH